MNVMSLFLAQNGGAAICCALAAVHVDCLFFQHPCNLCERQLVWGFNHALSGLMNKIGYQIGTTFKGRFLQFLQDYDLLPKMLIPFYQSTDGRKIVDAFEVTQRWAMFLELILHVFFSQSSFDWECSSQYPEYMDELRGMANATDIEFYKARKWFGWELMERSFSSTSARNCFFWCRTLPLRSSYVNGVFICVQIQCFYYLFRKIVFMDPFQNKKFCSWFILDHPVLLRRPCAHALRLGDWPQWG